MTWKWLLAMVFIDQLPWSDIYSVLGIYGTIAIYLLTVWGEIGLYAFIVYKAIMALEKSHTDGRVE